MTASNVETELGLIAAGAREAAAALHPIAPPTPLHRSQGLSTLLDCDVFLKCEHLMPTGSFKFRGAFNKLRLLDSGARRAGVVAASTGNHGQGVAAAAAHFGVSSSVFVPATASPAKIEAIRGWGAEVILSAGDCLDVEQTARAAAMRSGRTYISPYNDIEVIAGQGGIGVELAGQDGALDAVFISVGGGGLISGIGAALKASGSAARIVGCWPAHAPSLLRCIEAGGIVAVDERETLSDATAGAPEPDTVTLRLAAAVMDEAVEVDEGEIAAAMRRVAETDRWIVEGAAGVALAGLISRKADMKGKRVAVVLCGRNIALAKYLAAIAA